MALEALYTEEAIAQGHTMSDEEEVSPAAEVVMCIDPSVRNAYEEELVNPSPCRPRDDGGPAIMV